MSRLFSSSSPFLFKRNLCVLLVAMVSLLVIPEESMLVVNAQTVDIEALRNRVIDVTKGLNDAAVREIMDETDPTSYQPKALFRLSQQVGVDSFTDEKLAQYYSLYCIYYATSGVANEITNADVRFENIAMPEWLHTTNWKDATNADPCGTTVFGPTNVTIENSIATTLSATTTGGWYGVTCDTEGRVVSLQLYDNFLTGEFPEEVVLLASDGPFSTGAGNLKMVDLYQNEFLSNGGDSTWMSDLGSNMTTIIVEGTGFSGDIPLLPENLVNFNIRNAFYTGGFTDENFVLLNQLNYLNVDGNMFNTSIPPILSELGELEYLYMTDNFIVGNLSPLKGSPVLKEFWADGNPGLTGPLYSWLGNITSLASLSLAYNSLTGSIPVELGHLTDMEQMWLHFNNLTGSVPTELGQMTKLRHLELESNGFTGFVHASICEKTEFPLETLEVLGADCFDDNFFCPCCTCCDLMECVAGVNRAPTRL